MTDTANTEPLAALAEKHREIDLRGRVVNHLFAELMKEPLDSEKYLLLQQEMVHYQDSLRSLRAFYIKHGAKFP